MPPFQRGTPLVSGRVRELDALRGFAMCGIVFVNIAQITAMPRGPGSAADNPAGLVFDLGFYERFYPIFSFLFGLSFAIFLAGAEQRSDRPWLVAIRRLVAIGLIGLLHSLLQPGEVLRFYSVFGLVFLLPASYLPRRVILVLGVVGLVPSYFFGGTFGIPALFLLGLATARYGVPETISRRTRQLLLVFGLVVVLAVVGGYWQSLGGVGWSNRGRAYVAGLAFALAYTTAFLLLLRTPVRRLLLGMFEQLGRMALTNYLLATILIVAANLVLDLGDHTQYAVVVALGVAIGVVQGLISPLIMRRLTYGPVEWVWRCVTWWTVVPIRRGADAEPESTPTRTTPASTASTGETP